MCFRAWIKDLGRQILRVVVIAGAIVDVTIDLVNVPLVQETEGFWIGFGFLDQDLLVYTLLRQDDLFWRPPVSLNRTPTGANGCARARGLRGNWTALV